MYCGLMEFVYDWYGYHFGVMRNCNDECRDSKYTRLNEAKCLWRYFEEVGRKCRPIMFPCTVVGQ